MPHTPEKLWTASFVSACLGNFLLFFAFYLLLPIFPLYLIEEFDATTSMVGIILSVYTLAALLIRPFAAFMLDMYQRKPIYLFSFAVFTFCFIGYPLAASISLFLLLRILHGFTFGFVTTAANSFIIDIMPASRRGEGLGYFGVANNLAMAVGPMTGLFLHEYSNFDVIFYTAVGSGFLGFLFAMNIKSAQAFVPKAREAIAFDRFFLFKGINAGICLLLMGVAYGMLVIYIALYGRKLGLDSEMSFFFAFMSAGMVSARLFAGKLVDKGKLRYVIAIGTAICLAAFLILSGLNGLNTYKHEWVVALFFVVSILMGVGYGMIFPAYNTLFVNLAPNNRRATASSTYMTSWDIGIGLGVVAGGRIADTEGGLSLAYLVGSLAISLSLVYFTRVAGPHFQRYKLR